MHAVVWLQRGVHRRDHASLASFVLLNTNEMSALSEGILIAVCLLTWTEICSSQRFQINRKASEDYFTIPSSKCGKNDCRVLYKARKDSKNCKCVCDSTFSFYKELNWICIGNAKARKLFGKFFNLLFI